MIVPRSRVFPAMIISLWALPRVRVAVVVFDLQVLVATITDMAGFWHRPCYGPAESETNPPELDDAMCPSPRAL